MKMLILYFFIKYCILEYHFIKIKISTKKTLKILFFYIYLNEHTHKIKVDILEHQYPLFIFFDIPFFNIKVDIKAYSDSIHQGRIIY